MEDVVNHAAPDEKTAALLDATFKELMPREAILMHGTKEAFEKLDENITRQMRPLIEKLDALNALSRYITQNRPEPAEIKRRLAEIDSIKSYGVGLVLLCYAFVAGAFSVFFGSRSVIEVIAAVFIGGIVGIGTVSFERIGMQKPFSKLLCSFAACSLAFVFTPILNLQSADLIIIGNIMTLIPGVGLTNALRDIFTGDVISGILRSIESLLLGAVIAFGYVTAAFIFG